MHRFPDPEVERDLHPRLLVVVGLGNLHRDRDTLRVRLDVADIGDAIGTPKEAEELLGETGITEPYVHASHCL